MVFFSLAHQSESGLWCLVPSNIIYAINAFVVDRHDVLSYDCVCNFSLVVSATSLIAFFDDSDLVE